MPDYRQTPLSEMVFVALAVPAIPVVALWIAVTVAVTVCTLLPLQWLHTWISAAREVGADRGEGAT